MNPILGSLGLLLYDVGAFQDKSRSPEGKGFRLKLHEKNPTAPLSPYYMNLRTPDNPKPGPLTPDVVRMIGYSLYSFSEQLGLEYDYVVGIPRAGDPIAKAFWAAIPPNKIVNLLKLQKIDLEGGRKIGESVTGAYTAGKIVLGIDDLITKADTKREAIISLTGVGLIVKDLLLLIDREQGGPEELEKEGVRANAAFTISELLVLYLRTKRIDKKTYDEIVKYRAEN